MPNHIDSILEGSHIYEDENNDFIVAAIGFDELYGQVNHFVRRKKKFRGRTTYIRVEANCSKHVHTNGKSNAQRISRSIFFFCMPYTCCMKFFFVDSKYLKRWSQESNDCVRYFIYLFFCFCFHFLGCCNVFRH